MSTAELSYCALEDNFKSQSPQMHIANRKSETKEEQERNQSLTEHLLF